MNNRTVFIVGAAILAAAVGLELWYTNSNPVIPYASTGFNYTGLGQVNSFSYIKDGDAVGEYEYTVTADNPVSPSLYSTSTHSNLTYQGSHIVLDTILTFTPSTAPRFYGVNATVNATLSTIACSFSSGTVTIVNSADGENQNFTVSLPTGTAVLDNNNPAHWELLYRSFRPELGKVYDVNVFVPQSGAVYDYQIGLDPSTKPVIVGAQTYNCIVVREPDIGVVAYFYGGSLMRFDSQNDGVTIIRTP